MYETTKNNKKKLKTKTGKKKQKTRDQFEEVEGVSLGGDGRTGDWDEAGNVGGEVEDDGVGTGKGASEVFGTLGWLVLGCDDIESGLSGSGPGRAPQNSSKIV